MSTFILYCSYVISFHVFRLTYSRLFGKKAFSASFIDQPTVFKLMGRLSVFSIFFVYFAAVAANAYNLYYVRSDKQVFYFDIDSLIIVVYQCLLVFVVMTQREKVAGVLNIKEMVADVIKTEIKRSNIGQVV